MTLLHGVSFIYFAKLIKYSSSESIQTSVEEKAYFCTYETAWSILNNVLMNILNSQTQNM
jgi:hypothetical protein